MVTLTGSCILLAHLCDTLRSFPIAEVVNELVDVVKHGVVVDILQICDMLISAVAQRVARLGLFHLLV